VREKMGIFMHTARHTQRHKNVLTEQSINSRTPGNLTRHVPLVKGLLSTSFPTADVMVPYTQVSFANTCDMTSFNNAAKHRKCTG
jgi:hypothetical protein